MNARLGGWLACLLLVSGSIARGGEDPVLAWITAMCDANAEDCRHAVQDQPGPTFTGRAFAIVAAAMFDALNSIEHKYEPYLTEASGYDKADTDVAIATAAHDTLVALYPSQAGHFDAVWEQWVGRNADKKKKALAIELGRLVAANLLDERATDGSDAPMSYTPINLPGFHQVDPLHPGQGFHAPQFGNVTPFVIEDAEEFVPADPPDLGSLAYWYAYLEVYLYGGSNPVTTLRTQAQTEIGLFWAYDGAPGLGKPPRLYNQIVQTIAKQKRNSTSDNARLFALVNLAMGDAAIVCWKGKYEHEFWRPIVGIRNGDSDGNPLTLGDPTWTPYGAPFTNGTPSQTNFTPPFPAYASGHATFGAASLWTVAKFYGTDKIKFTFISDELNGRNKNQDGSVRPLRIRTFQNLSDAIKENGQSRIYLGIHWQFDAQEGIRCGKAIAEDLCAQALLPRKKRR